MSTLRTFAIEIDRILRGEDAPDEPRPKGQQLVPLRVLLIGSALLGVTYGLAMGLYALLSTKAPETPPWHGLAQMAATSVKVPLLFLLTVAVTFPSLYVTSALAGSRLRPGATSRLIVRAIAVHLVVLASVGPITAFFTLCTESYSFMKLLNVAFFAFGGFAFLHFLRKSLVGALTVDRPREPEKAALDTESTPRPSRAPTFVFRTWCVIYGVVGAQMGWVLRPFVGSPDLPFELFRARQSYFFENVLDTLRDLLL